MRHPAHGGTSPVLTTHPGAKDGSVLVISLSVQLAVILPIDSLTSQEYK